MALERKSKSSTSVTIFSLDYDGCSDILFDELIVGLDPTNSEKKELLHQRKNLEKFLDEKATESSETELYVGSLRQSHDLDEENHRQSKNGRCLTNLPKLSDEKLWKFRRLLLADEQNKKAAGTAFEDKRLKCKLGLKNNAIKSFKIATLMAQLCDASKNHPDKKIHFYFLDDDNRDYILSGIQQYVEHDINFTKSYPNICLYLIKFDWYGEAVEKTRTLKEFARFPAETEEKIKERRNLEDGYKKIFKKIYDAMYAGQIAWYKSTSRDFSKMTWDEIQDFAVAQPGSRTAIACKIFKTHWLESKKDNQEKLKDIFRDVHSYCYKHSSFSLFRKTKNDKHDYGQTGGSRSETIRKHLGEIALPEYKSCL